MKKLLTLLFFANSIICYGIQKQDSIPKPFEISIESSKENGIYQSDELAEVYVIIQNNSDSKLTGNIQWEITTDEQEPLKRSTFPITVEKGKKIYSNCPIYQFKDAGFYNYSSTITLENGIQANRSMNIGFAPESIKPILTKSADFDLFWEDSKKSLNTIEPEYKLTLQNKGSKDPYNIYLVEMKSLGGITVQGWLEVPKKKGKYPAILRVPGYTSNMQPVKKFDDMVIFSFNPRGHGDSEEGPDPLLGMWIRGLDDKETYYYRGAYLDCLRALDFLARRPEVDSERIAVWGGSQGGGFSFMTAALDDRISFCVADIPWLCDWVNYFKTTHWDEIDTWMSESPSRNWLSLLKTLSYFDTMNMADKIKCPVLMRIGLQDPVCPPATSFATYNLINSKKEFIVYPKSGHWIGDVDWDYGYQWLREKFEIK